MKRTKRKQRLWWFVLAAAAVCIVGEPAWGWPDIFWHCLGRVLLFGLDAFPLLFLLYFQREKNRIRPGLYRWAWVVGIITSASMLVTSANYTLLPIFHRQFRWIVLGTTYIFGTIGFFLFAVTTAIILFSTLKGKGWGRFGRFLLGGFSILLGLYVLGYGLLVYSLDAGPEHVIEVAGEKYVQRDSRNLFGGDAVMWGKYYGPIFMGDIEYFDPTDNLG